MKNAQTLKNFAWYYLLSLVLNPLLSNAHLI